MMGDLHRHPGGIVSTRRYSSALSSTECQALEPRRLLTAMVLDATDSNAYGGTGHPSAATTATGNDDYAALNWLTNTQTVATILGNSVRIWNGGTGTTLHTVVSGDTIS